MARECVDRGYVPVVRRHRDVQERRATLREALAVAPLDLLLVETDAPFLTPDAVPRAAERVVPDPAHGAGRWPQTRGQDLDELCGAVAANSERVFGPF